jgi:transcriptional regulator with XRE-family HTH domain
MTTADKIATLRRQNNYTQEQFASILDVTRQAVSRWESGTAYPETDKIIAMARLFDVSIDYLLRDEVENTGSGNVQAVSSSGNNNGEIVIRLNNHHYEWKSKTTLFGVPLVHVNIGFSRVAKGIIAIGNVALGVVSIGMVSVGLISLGLLAIGLLALGSFSLGVLSAGAVTFGMLCAGGIAIGHFAVGGVAVGNFAIGGYATGRYIACGGEAQGLIAIGKQLADGSYEFLTDNFRAITGQMQADITTAVDENIPESLMNWANMLLRMIGVK